MLSVLGLGIMAMAAVRDSDRLSGPGLLRGFKDLIVWCISSVLRGCLGPHGEKGIEGRCIVERRLSILSWSNV